ncbi:MAG TPA: hypothetical protein VGC99_03460, partial [Candidatus Tectomicrobia bacterium]
GDPVGRGGRLQGATGGFEDPLERLSPVGDGGRIRFGNQPVEFLIPAVVGQWGQAMGSPGTYPRT